MMSHLASRLLGLLAIGVFSSGVAVAQHVAPDYGDLSYLQDAPVHAAPGLAAAALPTCQRSTVELAADRPIQAAATPTVVVTAALVAAGRCEPSATGLREARVTLESSSDGRTWRAFAAGAELTGELRAHGTAIHELGGHAGACSVRARVSVRWAGEAHATVSVTNPTASTVCA